MNNKENSKNMTTEDLYGLLIKLNEGQQEMFGKISSIELNQKEISGKVERLEQGYTKVVRTLDEVENSYIALKHNDSGIQNKKGNSGSMKFMFASTSEGNSISDPDYTDF